MRHINDLNRELVALPNLPKKDTPKVLKKYKEKFDHDLKQTEFKYLQSLVAFDRRIKSNPNLSQTQKAAIYKQIISRFPPQVVRKYHNGGPMSEFVISIL